MPAAPIANDDEDVLELELLASQPSGAALARVVGATGSTSLIGRRVLVCARHACGRCEVCRRGGAAVCPDARATATRVSSRWAIVLGDALDLPAPAAAAVAGDITTAYTLYARTGLAPRDPVVVTGATAVARCLVQILRAKGLTPVVVGGDTPWAAFVTSTGALHAATAGDVGAAIATQGLGARPLRLIATNAESLATATGLAGPRATLTVLAAADLAALSPELVAREVVVIGVAGPHPDLVTEVAAMCAKREIDLAGSVTTDGSDTTRALVRAHV